MSIFRLAVWLNIVRVCNSYSIVNLEAKTLYRPKNERRWRISGNISIFKRKIENGWEINQILLKQDAMLNVGESNSEHFRVAEPFPTQMA